MIIKDVINDLPRAKNKVYPFRPIKAITHVAIHHSLTDDIPGGKDIAAFARYHVNDLGWPGIGYAYVIDADGIIYKTQPATRKSYHVGKHNYYTLGVCLVGDFRKYQPPDVQYEATLDLCSVLGTAYNVGIDSFLGHNEFEGYEWKHCPEIDMDMFRRDLFIYNEEVLK